MSKRIKIPVKVCSLLKIHNFVWPKHTKALIAGKCSRCGLNYKTYWNTEKAKNPKKYI